MGKAAAKIEAEGKSGGYPLGVNALTTLHQSWLYPEFVRQSVVRLERMAYRTAYEGKTRKKDLRLDGQDDWLSGVEMNQLRPEADKIQGEVIKRRIHPKISYLGNVAPQALADKAGMQEGAAANEEGGMSALPPDDDYNRIAELRNLQSRTLINRSSFFDERAAAVKDAVTTGDGWVHWGVRADPQNPGNRSVVCRHVPWENIIIDSLNSTATGNIDRCRFVAHFSLVELDVFCEMYPKFKSEAGSVSRGLPTARNAPIDVVQYFSPDNYNRGEEGLDDFYDCLIGTPEIEGREFVVYGKFYYKDTAGKVKCYPFLTDRNVTEIYQLARERWIYSHNMYPFLRWVDNLYQDMQPFPSIAEGKIGLERVMNYALRQVLKRLGGRMVIYDDRAIPKTGHGANMMGHAEYQGYLDSESERANPTYYTEKMEGLRVESMNAEAGQISQFLQALGQIMSGSGTVQNPHLSGQSGGSTPASGLALQQHRDTMLTGHNLLFSTDRAATEKLGVMNMFNLRDFDDIGTTRAFSDDRGRIQKLPIHLLPSGDRLGKVDLASVAAGDLGVFVEPLEGMGALTPDKVGVLNELIKGFAATPEINMVLLLALAKKFDFFDDDIKMIAEMMLLRGVPVPDILLDREQQIKKREMMKQNQSEQMKQMEQQMQMLAQQMDELQSKTEKNRAAAAKDMAQARATTAEAVGNAAGGGKEEAAAPAAGGSGNGSGNGTEAVLAENQRLREEIKRLGGNADGAGNG